MDTNLVVGPLVFSVVFNAFVYGICVLQFFTYWENYNMNDIGTIRALVGWTFLLDTFHTCALIYMMWLYVVTHFNDSTFLATIIWPYAATPIVTTLTSFPIQIYLSWRIRQFSRSKRVFLGLAFMSTAQATVGFTCSILAIQIPMIGSYSQLVPWVSAWQVLAVAADGSITVLLIWYLSRSRTGLKSSDNVITRVIRSTIETAAIGAFFCIMDLIAFTLWQGTNFHVVFAFPMGRIYTNTLLMTLNSRKSLRAELERPLIPDIAFDQSARMPSGPPVMAMAGPTSTGLSQLSQVSSAQQSSLKLNVTVYSTASDSSPATQKEYVDPQTP